MTGRTITSLTNPIVKAVRSLHMRKSRDDTGRFLAEGLKTIIEALDQGHAPRLLLYGPDAARRPLTLRAIDVAEEAVEVSPAILAKISRRENPQTVLAVFDQKYMPLETIEPATARCWVALQAVRDPGNLGTIIRTADSAGCGGVILIGDCCDPYSVEAVRATMGSIFAVPLVKADAEAFVHWRSRWPGTVVGTLLTAAEDFRTVSYPAPTLLLMGNEQAGLPAELAGLCDVSVKIPMRGRADSLNLAVATGVMIYAVTADQP